ncbi:MAG: ankyrin repeat domain-containing protein [Leptospiraceae bacterium]|nr:ankyrin repeat domain-containing protein [Leptospiraceae bacterium]
MEKLASSEGSSKCLYRAIKTNNPGLVEYLIDKKVSWRNSFTGENSLMLAVRLKSNDVIPKLLHGVSPMDKDEFERNALDYAIIHNNTVAFNLLLTLFPSDLKSPEYKNKIYRAVEVGNKEFIQTLITKGVRPEVEELMDIYWIVNLRGEDDVLDKIISLKLPSDAKDSKGDTPLHYAAKLGNLEAYKKLESFGIGFQKNLLGRTPFFTASCSGRKPIVDYLITKSAFTNEKDTEGNTALMCAVVEGHSEIVYILLALKPDLAEKNNSGKTVVDIAMETGNEEITQLILQAYATRK